MSPPQCCHSILACLHLLKVIGSSMETFKWERFTQCYLVDNGRTWAPCEVCNWCETSVMLILSKGLWGSNISSISKQTFHFKRKLKSDISWKWHCSFIRRAQKDEFVRQLFILHSLHFNIVLRPVPKMYFLLLASSSSITVTWWEGLTFLGWYKGLKIIINW